MEHQRMGLISQAVLVALLGAGAFWDGLYGPGHQLLLTTGLALLALQLRGATSLSRLETAAGLMLAAGALIALRSPAAAGTAAHGPVVLLGWLLAFGVGRGLSDRTDLDRTLAHIWAATGPLMVFGGLLAMSYMPVHHSGRLASFLGYPIAVGVLGMLGLAGALLPARDGRWWAPLLLFGSGLAVLLSGSRGVWAASLLMVLYLLWRGPRLLRAAWRPAAFALPAALWAGPAVMERHTWAALLPVLLGCLTVLLIEWFQAGRYRRPVWAAAGAAWLAAVAAAPGWGWFLGRATALPLTEGSSVERLTFLRDGLALFLEHPWGAGYRAWAALHLQGASYSYYSAEVHSAPLDIGLAFGWLGMAGFLLLLLALAWRLTRPAWRPPPERLAVMTGLGALALHALIDWDLSYGLFAVPLWLGLGLLRPAQAPVRVHFSVTAFISGLALAMALPIAAGDLFTWRAQLAMQAGSAPQAYRYATVAATASPWNDLSHAVRGQALSAMGEREAALAAFSRARALGPYEPWYAELQARELHAAGRSPEAAEAYRDLTRLWPWQVSAYESALEAHMEMAMRAQLQGDTDTADALRESGRGILDSLDRQRAKEPPGRPRKAMQTNTFTIRQARQFFGP